MNSENMDVCNVMVRMLKYAFLGIGVAFSLYSFPEKPMDSNTILLIATISSLIYSILDSPLLIKENYYNWKK